ncbi:MAG: tail fiber domain-containing protein [Chitinophagaceae bacterium]|nr:tail fiber domain-containing protein [Chitinophagaceae bacterium]
MKKTWLIIGLVAGWNLCFSQVAINTDNTVAHGSAMLDIKSTTKGLLVPRLTTAQINAISNPATGLQVFNITTNQLWINTGTATVPKWETISANNAWGLGGNAGTTLTSNFIGTADNAPLMFRIDNSRSGLLMKDNTWFGFSAGNQADSVKNIVAIGAFALSNNNSGAGRNVAVGPLAAFNTIDGTSNTMMGFRAGFQNTAGSNNIAVGINALNRNKTNNNLVAIGDSALFNNDGGSGQNTAIGSKSLALNTTGSQNTGVGFQALANTTVSVGNTAVGRQALLSNTLGLYNSALGGDALRGNVSGDGNTALGHEALTTNIGGNRNVALGPKAMRLNISGSNSVALGDSALAHYNGTIGRQTAVGSGALGSLTTGERNTAVGFRSLYGNSVGKGNVAVGNVALHNTTADGAVAVGDSALFASTTGVQNTALGYGALRHSTSQSFNTAVGFEALHSNIGFFAQGNTGLGWRSLRTNSGSSNTGIGAGVLQMNGNGNNNVGIGNSALLINSSGNDNVAVGYLALASNLTGEKNIAIGGRADVWLTDLINATVIGYGAEIFSSNAMRFGNDDVTKWGFGILMNGVNHAIEVGDDATNGNGAYLSSGGTWTNTSDATKKEDFTEVNGSEHLQKIASLKISKWKYKNSEEYHIGPTAQDFYQRFRLGLDDKSISTIDPAGVSLLAIQELIKQNEALKARIEKLEQLLIKKAQ